MLNNPTVSPRRDDEIDIVELIRALWQRKFLIAGITFAATLIALAYALMATPYYQTQTTLRPASAKDLDELNSSGLYKLSPEEALKRVGAGIDSYEYRLEFFRKNQELFDSETPQGGATLEQAFSRVNEDMKTLRPDPKRSEGSFPFVGLSYIYPANIKGPEITNGLIEYVIGRERVAIAQDVEVIVQNRLTKLEQTMAAERSSYQASKEARIAALTEADDLKRAKLNDELKALRKQLRTRREDRIAQLNEAILIARSLNIVRPATPSSLGNAGQPAAGSQGNVIRTEVNNQQIPLYFMGTDALEAEKAALQKRGSDDFTEPRVGQIEKELQLLNQNREIEQLKQRDEEDLFIGAYADWHKEAAKLKNLNLNLANLNLVNIDQYAGAPYSPVKPKKALILAAGLVLGVMLGVFVALVRILVSSSSRKN
ncbi:Wzz/FepE/Etk N-terminal domain-containing protein [Pseudomonas kuykendallii]|uniref:LPS O-antigen chain length determinant protein, WzzB/FepE family n=1 Tax=Pseudomonas kuykendallii TaxID=1007099 RepID=A0A1H3GG08_9PSED|nr:Wzz/FepE/Etk N-terminal domain-containing protein [Pseudomonas kuykendallii]MCQ4271902.1 Wzz/FepE/Etk N-terminal domain-containing protein [Pseudomonas kuykendallii]SDY01239.1 LPS O-antigen chain length determinant protein, WzzB/FepE family [Pseudomonas kuykendallii]